MAEFKLGRIRFVWQGEWTTGHTYYKDDVVKFGGKVYICQTGHVGAASFYTNLANWDLMSDGQVWTGDWTTNHTYKLNDLVKYGGLVYICTTTHTSAATDTLGLEADLGKWDLVADGFDWKGPWAPSTRYKLHDIVKYGGISYVCNAHHTSETTPTLGLEPDLSNWDEFNQGLEFKGTWITGTRYKLNDVVKYGANLWICTEYNTAASTFEADVTANKWDAFVEGLQYENDWSSSTVYQPGDVVHYGGNQYVSTSNHSNSVPTAGTDWDLFSRGFSFQSAWSIGTAYKVGQVVNLNGYIYLCVQDHTGHEPPNGTYWSLLSSGTKWLGEWANSTAYKSGDLVRYGANVYICILAHTSADDDSSLTTNDTAKSPITDLTATYWNVFNVGSETAVMQVTGDIVYYAENGPVRLPIGSEGQVLKVDGASTPVWDYLGVVDYVYYVAPNGSDTAAPTFGRTLDKPWKTIRYACEQVEQGCRNPVTKRLLELNRVFIQREVTKWIEYQISTATIGSIWYNYTYDTYKCERDVGFIVDRLIWDISHGGNLKTRAAAQTYVNALSEGPYSTGEDENGTGTYTAIANEGDNDVAAFNYMLDVIEAVINQETPAANYQALAGDSSTAVVTQEFDSNITVAEAGALATITELVGIVTTALTDGSSANIPERYVPSNVISVKAGVYYETLPIIVPAETCILGDEVRAVTVSPAGSLVSTDDVPYSIATYDRLESVVNSVIAGATVTKTTGNVLSQDISWPYAGVTEQTDITRLIRAMKYKVDFSLGTMISASMTNPTGYNVSFPAAGYGDARALIKANKKFAQEQVVAWMMANYPTLKYGKTKTRQDVGYIVDAMVYDLTYGGNALSVQAGLAYYDGDDNTQPLIPASIKSAVLGAQTYLKSVLGAIATNTVVTPNQTVVAQTTGTAGSAGSATFVAANMDTIYAIINTGPGAVYTLTDPSTAWVDSALTTAQSTLLAANETIVTNAIDYINNTYGDFTYNSSICRRDLGYLVDAAYYDAAFGSNFWAVQNGLSYLRSQASVVTSQQLEAEVGSVNYLKSLVAVSLASNSTAVTRANAAYTEIVDILQNGLANVDAISYTDSGTANFTNARAQLVTNRAFIISEMVTWMTANVPGYVALSAAGKLLCQRDLGYAIDALAYDVNYGGNLATRNFCRSLFNNITGTGIESVNSGSTYTRLGVVVAQIVRETYAGQDTSGTAASATEATRMTTLCGNISTVATAGNLSGLVAESAPSITWVAGGIQTAVGTLATNKTAHVKAALQYISDNYNSFTYSHAKAERDATKVLKAVSYDFMFNSNYQTIKAAYAYLRSSGSEVFDKSSILKDVVRASLEYARTQAIANVGGNSTVISRINTLMKLVDDIIYSGSSEGSVCQTEVRAADYAALQLERNKPFIIEEIRAWIANTYPSYTYNTALCLRDVSVTIDALKYDIKNLGNYHTSLAARYYVNAVAGSLEEDMYYLRNGTGVRNQTLTGLTGDLTPENEYGTSRTTAGAYTSLDPGWGPDDFRTWITARSPYIQNCATFGTAAIGQKIDGALHNGGNKSFVSNDFTQLISDGIGAWVTNNARAELVSVFSYYSHIGYLAENGGRIRGTNGNNSYGDFGSVAEGYDSTETSLGAIVDNRYQFKATVGKIPTSQSQMYHFEYDHAGAEYTEATWLVVGPGNFGSVEQDEFRDNGVSQIRLLDNVDDSTGAPEADGNIGGYGYIFKTNTAQSGTTTSITLAATDDSASTAYIGMKILITAGSGVGQYALVSTYSNGTKIAGVITESTGAAGWDHFIPGTAITAPDSSSTYQIEPAVSFTGPTFATTTSTVPSGTWTTSIYGNTAATYLGQTGTYSGSGVGATFTVIRNGSKYYVTKTASGNGYTRLETITILGTSLGGTSPANDLTITITSVNSVTGGIQAVDFDGYGLGGRFIALNSGSRNGATSEDGITWTTRANLMPTASNWIDMAYGNLSDGSTDEHVSLFVAVANGSANTAGAYSLDGLTWNASNMVTSATWAGVAFGNNLFVAIASDSTTVRLSYDGIIWDTTGTLPSTGFTSIAYGMGLFVAIKTGADTAVYSTNGITWSTSSGGLPTSTNWSSVTWGNGRFVAVSSSSVDAGAYSLNGTSWTAMTLPTTTSWKNVAYGQGVFLAVSSGTAAATSEDGVNWTARTLTTAASGYSSTAFGNPQRSGIFASVGAGTGTVANYTTFGAKTRARAYVESNKIVAIRLLEPGSGYSSAPTITITDPNNTYEAPTQFSIAKGVIANPSFKNRGTGYTTSSAELQSGDGYAETYQNGSYLAVRRITSRPTPGSNVVIEGMSGTYKLVNVVSFVGEYDGDYTAFYQISPVVRASQSIAHGAAVTTRIRYSQVRLTGHDFLNIGFGNFIDSNYPGNPINGNTLTQSTETVESNGGRVFYTSTDQDGNFRVGDLFTVEQSTGVATLNADAFNVSGLQELSLGNLALSGNSASITEFSTDPFFTANSDSVVPTQRAIKAYIASQIGGGGASLIVNSITAGSIFIAGNVITTVTNESILMNANFEFRGSITGLPLAFNYFLT